MIGFPEETKRQGSGGDWNKASLRITGRMVMGVVVVLLGVVFLLDELDVANAGQFLRYWPALPFAYGLALMGGVLGRRQLVGGALLSFFSGWFLLKQLGVINRGPWDFWPLALVVLGASMVYTAVRGPASATSVEKGTGTLNAFALWSGSNRKVVSEDFRGGEITAIMGGHEIDLRPAKIVGANAVIDLFVWWGGVELKVPADWKVTSEAVALLGGVDDQSRAPEGEGKGHLILRGMVVMGGVEVKN